MADRGDERACRRRLSRTGQGHAEFRLWLFPVAASGSAAPVRARRRQRPAPLRRSNFETGHGSHRRREYRRGLAFVVRRGRAIRPGISARYVRLGIKTDEVVPQFEFRVLGGYRSFTGTCPDGEVAPT